MRRSSRRRRRRALHPQAKERAMFSPHGTFSPIQLIIPLIVLLLCLAFWGWMFRDMVENADLPSGAKETWTFAFILLNVFAAIVYYNAVYRHRH